MTNSLKIIAASFLITAGLIKGAPAAAEPVAAPVNVSLVHTGDLDLTTADGRRQLEQRLSIAAREVCGTASSADLEGQNQARACRHDALAQARAKTANLLAGRATVQTIAIAAR